MLLVALLDLERSKLAAFRTYERKVAAIMRRHGGVIERALELECPSPSEVRELHILRFTDAAALAAYRADAEYVNLGAERAACVRATTVYSALELRPTES